MSLRPVLWSIRRVHFVDDGNGGEVEAEHSEVRRYAGCLLRPRRSSSEERLEEGAHGSPGPGLQTAYRRVIAFRKPFPTLKINDVLFSPDHTEYTIHFVRPYEWTMQVDVEVLT